MMTTYMVRKRNTRGEQVFAYTAELVERLPAGVLLTARWTRPRLELGYTTFEPGDRFREWFFTDRWYNIFEITAPDGVLKGWYCNIATPATITADVVSYRDLALDLWVDSSGAMTTLDEAEFAEDTALDADTRAAAEAALGELRRVVEQRAAPFTRLATQ